MADKKISALAVQAALDGTEQVEVLVGGTNKRMLFGLGYVRGAPEQTASFTAAPFFEYPLDTTSATPIVQTLPAAPPDGTLISGKWTKGANATATAVCSGTDHFNTSTGATSVAYEYLNTKYDFLYVASIGVWLIETSFSKGGLQLFLQPLDSDLTAIAALATTAFGRAFLAFADAAAARTAIGSVIGTNVQAWDADLDAVAALATTTYGRSLLTLASQSAYATLLAADAAFTAAYQPLDSDLTAIAALATTSYGRGLLTSVSQSALATLLAADAALTSVFAPLPTTLVSGRYYRLPNGTLQTSATLGNGIVRAARKFIPSATTLIRLGTEVSVVGDVGSHYRLGIWNDLNGKPDTLVLDAGTIAGDSVAVQEITISQALSRGWYWFGGAVQDTTVTQPTLRILNIITEPTVVDLGTSTPTSNLVALGGSYTGATAVFNGTPTWGSSTSGVPSLFGKVQ